jgi:hypothetical protein
MCHISSPPPFFVFTLEITITFEQILYMEAFIFDCFVLIHTCEFFFTDYLEFIVLKDSEKQFES